MVPKKFRLEKTVMARHRGMITSARIAALTELEEDWITALPGHQEGQAAWPGAEDNRDLRVAAEAPRRR